MKYNKIAIDISNFFHRAYFTDQALAELKKEDLDVVKDLEGFEIISGGIVLFFKMLQRVEREFLNPDGEVYFLFDNCHSVINKRKEIDPEYKANREPREDTFYKSLDFLNLILMNYKNSYFTIKKQGLEADDLVESFIKKFEDDDILLVTNDFDWFRAITSKVRVAKYDSFKKSYDVYGPEKFKEKFGFYPTNTKMCIYKSIRGDKGDNIPIGIKGLRTKVLIKLVEEYDSIKSIYTDIENIDYLSATFKQKFIENRARLLMNYTLVDYLQVTQEELNDSIFSSKFNPKTLLNLYKSLNLEAINIDPRVYQYFIKKENKPKSFFKAKKIPRI